MTQAQPRTWLQPSRAAVVAVVGAVIASVFVSMPAARADDADTDLPASTLPSLFAFDATSGDGAGGDDGDEADEGAEEGTEDDAEQPSSSDGDDEDSDGEGNEEGGDATDLDSEQLEGAELPGVLLAAATDDVDEQAVVWAIVTERLGEGVLHAAQGPAGPALELAMAKYAAAMTRLDEALALRDQRREAREEMRDERDAQRAARLEAVLERRAAAVIRGDDSIAALGGDTDIDRPSMSRLRDQARGGPPSDRGRPVDQGQGLSDNAARDGSGPGAVDLPGSRGGNGAAGDVGGRGSPGGGRP